jgi:CelD/BcsL family acetyltransferase involved in cellulose biosynthesis
MTMFAQFEFDEALLRQAAGPADAGQFVAEIKPARGLTEHDRTCWARLTARAGSGNIFAADWFMASALRHCASQSDVRLAIVRSLDGEWLGVLPLTYETMMGRWPLPGLYSWAATNQFDATPLIERGSEHIFWHCLLAWMDRRPGLALSLCCEQLPLDDPATRALIEVCLAQGRHHYETDRLARPMAGPGALSNAAIAARRKLDKRLDGLARKLHREVGEPRFVTVPSEADPAPWIAEFLALERSGWKGGRASALGCNQGTAGLFRQVIRVAHQQGAVRLMSLDVAGQIIAMTSWYVQGKRGYGFKMAYDERFRVYAPGRLLMREVAAAAQREQVTLFDSCAPRDAPPDPLWPEMREFVSYAVSVGSPPRRAVLAVAMRAARLYAQRNA